MKKEMLINVLQPEECRIAIVEDGVLEELYVERTSLESYTGNIYKGKIVNLEPAIQAAFVDFSVGRNGFLHVSDVEPQYYHRHLAAGDDLSPRDKDREPRRDRPDREPRRDRDARPRRGDDRDAGSAGPRDRDRDRPDRSEKGRRDRSESRRFGEGLLGDDDFGSSSAPPPARPTPPPTPPPAPAPEPPIPSFGREDVRRAPREESMFGRLPERDWDRERERDREVRPPVEPEAPRGRAGRAPEPFEERSREREREVRPPVEPEEPRGRIPRAPSSAPAPEPFDPDLPPSRTQRQRPQPPAARGPAPAFDDDLGRARLTPARPVDPEPEPDVEPEFRAEPPAARERDRDREPRRGRRGRGPRQAPAPGPEPEADDLFGRDVLGEPVEPEAIEPEAAIEPEIEERNDPPRRRGGGRAAIRSRGGDREPERPRERPPLPPVERERPPVEREREPDPSIERLLLPERDRERERERDRDRGGDRERPRAVEPEAPRDRPRQAHGRAGEPGYVPRRERTRGGEPAAFGPEPIDWVELDAEADVEAESDLTSPLIDEPAGDEGKADGPRRRRRRRGRRRDRERPEAEAGAPLADDLDVDAETDADIDADVDADFDDDEAGPPARVARPEPSRRPAARPRAEDREFARDFDFGDDLDDDPFADDEASDDLDDGDEPVVGAAVASPEDDQIDPGLEEEIRREIEEIAELEREMGLRGTTEARPRRGDDREAEAPGGRGGPGRPARGRGLSKPPIQEIFRRGDEVLVQVIKESIGTKGPTLSTYISIPGRYLVLMPGLNRVGVSRKIADEGQRRKLREIMNELNPPKGLGFIVRTAGLERTKRELARDLAYLLRLWKVILRRIKKARTPAPIYQESDMITRTIRDIFTSEIDTIWIDEPQAFERAQEFLRVVMPKFVDRLKLYDERVPLFHKYGIEDEIAKIQRRHVPLPEGGSIVIDQTEALVAIDVNSGNFRVENDAERTAYEMNLRAAKEIARQLRLRDLGGVIVNDFIDMRDEKHRRGVEKALRDAIKRDRARTKVLRMSAFGLIEMTRQRIRPSLKRSVYEDCPHCTGAGVVKTVESMSIDVMRLLALASHREDIRRVNVSVSAAVAAHLNNRKRRDIARIESEANMVIHIRSQDAAPAEHLQIDCYDAHNTEIRLMPLPAPTGRRPHTH